MTGRFLAYVALLSVACVSAESAQIGDVNDDGRVSFGDSYLLRRWIDTGLEVFRPAAGSDRFSEFIRCDSEWEPLPELVYIESLRRANPSGSLPHRFEVWPSAAEDAELPLPDSRVRLELDPVVLHSGSDSDIELRVRLITSIPLDALGLILGAEDLVLRAKEPRGRIEGGRGDVRTRWATQYYVVSGGLVAFHTDISEGSSPSGIEPSELELILPVNIPRGTPPGKYTVRLLPGTEVVTRFGEVLRPELAPGTLEIREPITSGHDLPFPPLRFDLPGRRILGKTEIRISEGIGVPGDEVRVRIQLRTERPTNYLTFTLTFDHRSLFLSEATPLYRDPQSNAVIPEDFVTTITNDPPFDSGGLLNFEYAPRLEERGSPSWRSSRDHSYSYLNPLGDWIDLVELRFAIRPEAAGAVLPLSIVDRPGFARAIQRVLAVPEREGVWERTYV